MSGVEDIQPPDALADLLAKAPPLGPWVEHAGCADLGDAFTADNPAPGDVAVLERVCRKCPVRAACAAYADDTGALGMWGGVFRSAAFYRRSRVA